MMHVLANVAGFQACWFASVLAAAHGAPWAGPLVTVAWLTVHLPGQRPAAWAETRLVAAAAALGWLADSSLVLSGLLSFPEPAHLGGPSPLWMAGLWAAFAATLRHALGWLRGRPLAAAVLGAAGGPLAYLGGEALGAIGVNGAAGAVAVAVQYAVAVPALLALAARLETAAPLASTAAGELRP